MSAPLQYLVVADDGAILGVFEGDSGYEVRCKAADEHYMATTRITAVLIDEARAAIAKATQS